jgi:cell division transport system permease protein
VAAVIRHALAEGWLLLRHRGLVSLFLALALAIPIGLAGITFAVMRWLDPVVGTAERANVVGVLLHPHMGDDQRAAWLSSQRRDHPEWRLEVVPPEQLAQRLTHWFPYLKELLEREGGTMLPPLVEISTVDPESVAVLERSPAVIAVGPRTPLTRLLGRVSRSLVVALSAASAVLLIAAALLAAVWVHLELYRHADEITIMRLVGATESAIRGPFLVATAAPGLVAGVLALIGTSAVVDGLSRLAEALGLPALTVSPGVLAAQAGAGVVLPLAAATITLMRHAAVGDE